MALLLSIGAFALINLLAAMSPGPDFLVVSKNSLAYSRKIGIGTALGVGAGIFVHVTYSIIGIGLIISKSILLFSAIKLLGAVYLVYLGMRLIFSTSQKSAQDESHVLGSTKTFFAALREGFFVNALNPKASIFFVSLFSQFFSPGTPTWLQALYGIEAAFVVGLWFVCLAVMLTHKPVKKRIERVQGPVMKLMGFALVLLGLKVALARQ